METLKSIASKLKKIEKTLKKICKEGFDDIDSLQECEDSLESCFSFLDENEAALLKLDVRSDEIKHELLYSATLVSQCEQLSFQIEEIQKKMNEDYEEDLPEEREVWEMMYPNEDIDSNDFEVGEFEND